MATDVLAPGADEPDDRTPEQPFEPRPQHHSYFAVYKKGQGYWTRMGTALGVLLLLTVACLFVYEQSNALLVNAFYTSQEGSVEAVGQANREGAEYSARMARLTAVILTAVLGTAGALFAWVVMNKPRNVDFLIATDVEMHKVNWTSRQELFGSTRVVIFFLFLIAAILFLVDVGTGALFQLIGLLKFGPLSN